VLQARVAQTGMDAKSIEWYTDLRRYGSVPHAGWGMGFERLVLFATGLDNIRDAIPVPRHPNGLRL
jgi:asparaginyl-tRNA synthetase